MLEVPEFWGAIAAFFEQPAVRLVMACVSVGAFIVSLWSLKRTYDNTAVDQARHIESQWQAIYHLTLNNPKVADYVSTMFDYDGDAEDARRGSALLMYINVLASTHHAYQRRLLTRDVYEAHMKSFFHHYKGSYHALEEAISIEGYNPGFIDECRRFMALGQRYQAEQGAKRDAMSAAAGS